MLGTRCPQLSSGACHAVAQLAHLVAQRRGALELEGRRRLLHLLLQLTDHADEFFARDRLGAHVVGRLLFGHPAEAVGQVPQLLGDRAAA